MAKPARELSPDDLDKKFSELHRDRCFYLWLDRQKRATVGVSASRGVGESRQKVGDDLFLKMFKTLVTETEKLIPTDRVEAVFYTYSVGNWQRSKEFHIKAHLSVDLFLTLADNLARPDRHSLHRQKSELEKRKADNRCREFREVFVSSSKVMVHTAGRYQFMVSRELSYPLVCIYQTEKGKVTADIAMEQLPEALSELEKFVIAEWKQKGFNIGLVKTGQCFNVAANVVEEDFAKCTSKDPAAVKEAWGWKEPKRKYHGKSK